MPNAPLHDRTKTRPPLLLLGGHNQASIALLLAAFAVQYAGLLAERWFFFAQARHPQNLYYQAVS